MGDLCSCDGGDDTRRIIDGTKEKNNGCNSGVEVRDLRTGTLCASVRFVQEKIFMMCQRGRGNWPFRASHRMMITKMYPSPGYHHTSKMCSNTWKMNVPKSFTVNVTTANAARHHHHERPALLRLIDHDGIHILRLRNISRARQSSACLL